MSASSLEEHLSQLQTQWSLVRCAHGERATQLRRAQELLLQCYGGAARRYLLAALRDQDAADDVYQEFALRLVRGDFRTADPNKGRFRSFLKASLYRMIVDHQRRRARKGTPLSLDDALSELADNELPENDEAFDQSWRDELLSRAWRSLQQEEQVSGKPLYAVLRYRVEHSDWRSPELAAGLSRELGHDITATNARVMLHRSRERFTELLLCHVSHSLGNPTREELELELIELNLLDDCRRALAIRYPA